MGAVQHVRSGDGTPIAYRAAGEGEPILFVHGSGTSSGDWMFVLPSLRERFTVVTMDRRGRGESGDSPGYAMLEMIRSSPAWPVLLDAVPTLPRELGAARGWDNARGPFGVPTLYLLGADTRNGVYLDGLDELQAAFADIRTERIEGQRHIAHVFAAERFAGLVADFCGAATRAGTPG